MTDGIDQALATAGLALLATDGLLLVLDGGVPPNTPPPYVVVYVTVDRPPNDPTNALDGRSRTWTARWICHCVGGGQGASVATAAAAARAVAQRVRTQLLDVRPVVAGLSCGLIRWEQSTPPQRDETTGVPVMDAVEIYRLQATS